MPSNVRLRFFHLSGPGGSLCTLWPRPSTICVGTSIGSPRVHQHVALHSGSPNIHGCTIWSGLRHMVDRRPIGFSIATRWQSTCHKVPTNARARAAASVPFDFHQRAPLTARSVHGGWNMHRSHCEARLNSTTSPTWCRAVHPSSAGSRSHDHASCPSAWNARRIRPEYSQPINTRIPALLRPPARSGKQIILLTPCGVGRRTRDKGAKQT